MNSLDEAMRKLFLEVLQSPEAGEAINGHLAKYLQENGYKKDNSDNQDGTFTVSESGYQEIKNEIEKLERRLLDKQEEIDSLRRNLDDSKKVINWQKIQLVEKQNEINDLNVKNEQLSVELMQSNKSVEEMKQLQQMEAESRYDAFDQKLGLKDKEISHRDRIIRDKDIRIQDLNEELDKRDSMYINLLDEIDMYKDRNEVLECEKDQLFDELTKLQQLCEEKLGKGWRFDHDYAKMVEALEEDESDSEETPNAETETVDPEEAELAAMIAEEEREKAIHQEKEAEDSEKNTPPTTEEYSENVY